MSGVGGRPSHEDHRTHDLKCHERIEVFIEVQGAPADQINDYEKSIFARVDPNGPWPERNRLIERSKWQQLGFKKRMMVSEKIEGRANQKGDDTDEYFVL